MLWFRDFMKRYAWMFDLYPPAGAGQKRPCKAEPGHTGKSRSTRRWAAASLAGSRPLLQAPEAKSASGGRRRTSKRRFLLILRRPKEGRAPTIWAKAA